MLKSNLTPKQQRRLAQHVYNELFPRGLVQQVKAEVKKRPH